MDKTVIIKRVVFEIGKGFNFVELFRGTEIPQDKVGGIDFTLVSESEGVCEPEAVYTASGRVIQDEMYDIDGLLDIIEYYIQNIPADVKRGATDPSEESIKYVERLQTELDSFYTVLNSEKEVRIIIGYLEYIDYLSLYN